MVFPKLHYQFRVIATAILILLVAYFTILSLLDNIIDDYNIYNSAKIASKDPQGIDRREGQLARQLAKKQEILDQVLAKKQFSQNIFQELAREYKCRFVHLENRRSPKDDKTIYEVSYSGSIKGILNLLHKLETVYFVDIQSVAVSPDNESGSLLRIKITMTAGEHEL